MDEKKSISSVILKVIFFILFGGIIFIMYALTDGVFDAVDMFTDLFSRKDKNNKINRYDHR